MGNLVDIVREPGNAVLAVNKSGSAGLKACRAPAVRNPAPPRLPFRVAKQEDLYQEVAAMYGPALARLARAYETDADRVRDLLQDIHVALWQSLARFEGRCSLRTWVYRVAHNVATSQVIRRRAPAPT